MRLRRFVNTVVSFVRRMMRAQNLGDTPGLREYMASTRILEINPNHRIIQYLDVSRITVFVSSILCHLKKNFAQPR